MIVEILNTGTELLLGDVTNTHLPRLAERLHPLGLRIARQSTIPDGGAIRGALLESFGRCDLLIVTGGLGPTTDDVTREVVAEILGLPLEGDPAIEAAIRERLAKRGFQLMPRMLRQAMVPRGASVLPNAHGTAPGLYLPPIEQPSTSSPHLFLLPGPPRELLPMLDDHAIPLLGRILGGGSRLEKRTYHIVGIGESAVEQTVGLELSERGDVEVGYCARPGEVDLRVIAGPAVLDAIEPLILAALGSHLVSKDGQSLEEVVVGALLRRKEHLALAESCTGGLVASKITDVPGASHVFPVGWVTYSNEQKISQLGVDPLLLNKEGAVSAEVAEAMAQGALKHSGADYALSLTGIAGPGGGTPDKPVGTVFLALAERNNGVQSRKEFFPVDRATFKLLACQKALDWLRCRLTEKEGHS